MEDYPTQNIALNYTAMAAAVRSPFNNVSSNPPLSKIPLQFALEGTIQCWNHLLIVMFYTTFILCFGFSGGSCTILHPGWISTSVPPPYTSSRRTSGGSCQSRAGVQSKGYCNLLKVWWKCLEDHRSFRVVHQHTCLEVSSKNENSVITHPHVFPDLRSSLEHKLLYFKLNLRTFWPCIDIIATTNLATKIATLFKNVFSSVSVFVAEYVYLRSASKVVQYVLNITVLFITYIKKI